MKTDSGFGKDVRTVELRPSDTAMGAAALRAMAAMDESGGARGPDYLAEYFLPEENRAPLRDPAIRDWVIRNRVTPGMYEYMIARTAFFDEKVMEALGARIPQIVFLGAGYDTRSYRFRDLLGETRVFELDMAPTQRHKRGLLERAGIAVPEQLRYVSIDFTVDDIGETLERAGFDKARRVLFVWEGVTYYLPADAVDRTLAAVGAISSPGSCLCFDYASRSPERLDDERVQKLREAMKSNYPGEPTHFGLKDGEIEAFLAVRGFRILEHLTAEEIDRKYLTLPDGSSAGSVPALNCFVHASPDASGGTPGG
jgi:methyltransferase (TIGR00027 family)